MEGLTRLLLAPHICLRLVFRVALFYMVVARHYLVVGGSHVCDLLLTCVWFFGLV